MPRLVPHLAHSVQQDVSLIALVLIPRLVLRQGKVRRVEEMTTRATGLPATAGGRVDVAVMAVMGQLVVRILRAVGHHVHVVLLGALDVLEDLLEVVIDGGVLEVVGRAHVVVLQLVFARLQLHPREHAVLVHRVAV